MSHQAHQPNNHPSSIIHHPHPPEHHQSPSYNHQSSMRSHQTPLSNILFHNQYKHNSNQQEDQLGQFLDKSMINHLSCQQFLNQIIHLQQVISYLVKDKNNLKEQCLNLQQEINNTKISSSRQKQTYQAEIRKLREMVNEKSSQCESILKISGKQKEIIEQQNERIKLQIKLIIEKKNDELFQKIKQKDIQIRQCLKQQQDRNEALIFQHTHHLNQSMRQISSLQKQLQAQKLQSINLQRLLQNSQIQSQLLKSQLESSHEKCKCDMRQQYHTMKRLLIQKSSQQLRIIEDNNVLEKYILQLQIEQLKLHIDELYQQMRRKEKVHSCEKKQLNGYIKQMENQIQELSSRIQTLYNKKQKQVEELKIMKSFIHQNQTKIAKNFELRIDMLSKYYQRQRQQGEQLRILLEDEMRKNTNLFCQLRALNGIYQQKIHSLKMVYSQLIDAFKLKYQSQNISMINDYQLKIKLLQEKLSQLQIDQQKRYSEHNMLLQKAKEAEQLANSFKAIKQMLECQNIELKGQIKILIAQKSEQVQRLIKLVQGKDEEIIRLNNQFFESKGEDTVKCQGLLHEIQSLKHHLRVKQNQNQQLKDLMDVLKSKTQQSQRNQIKAYQQLQKYGQIIKQKMKGRDKSSGNESNRLTEEYVNKKIEQFQREKQQMNLIERQKDNRVKNLMGKMIQMEEFYESLDMGFRRRGELEEALINLGGNQNLIKNIKQMLEC